MEPLEPCFKELEPFLEFETEYPKRDFIERVAYQVSYYAITMLKLLTFHKIGKDGKGNLYIY
jgi:hypothetical protein